MTHLPEPLHLKISPLISWTLLALYLALTLPLPVLAQQTDAPISGLGLGFALFLGGGLLWGSLSQRVELDQEGIRINYPAWVPGMLRRQWALAWSEIVKMQPRGTSQGGLVYYLVTTDGTAYLLPMRVAGFSRMMQQIHHYTGLDTELVRPLAQPWMYGTLAVFTVLLLAVDAWVLQTALTLPQL